MKISLNDIKYYDDHFGCAPDPTVHGLDDLTKRIGAQLGAIEEIIDIGRRFNEVIVVKIVSCEDHPNADRLHVCRVDDGGKFQGVDRDEHGYVQVVCGAPNVRAGMLAAWLPPGAIVPNTIDKDPFVLAARNIRGQISNGMMASPRELGLGDSHEGIIEITEIVEPGASFAEIAHLKDEVVIDIENKMFTHRPDCFGFLGVARELAGIQGQAFKSPDWYHVNPEFPATGTSELKLEVRNELPELVPRFTAIAMADVEIKPGPLWLQALLSSVGLRPINNIVDYTNYFMLLTAQPLHAYDYDKVKAQDTGADHATLVVRKPLNGEKLLLLNGKEVAPPADTIMIATRDKAIGVGGAMGGGDTEVDEHTKNIIIECANFDMYSIRRTSMALGLFTDAVTRFTKGQSPLQNLAVLQKIVREIADQAGGKVASGIIDDNHLPDDMRERNTVHEPVSVTPDFINVRLGLKLSKDDIVKILQNVEFKIVEAGDQLHIQAPFWRTDIEIPEDIVEEVGRLYGYDHLPLELPNRDLTPAAKDRLFTIKSTIRHELAKAGANEVLTYSFVHGDLIGKVGQDTSKAYQIGNAISPDLQYYRMSITPSLLDKIHANIKAGYDEFALFEIGKAHLKDQLDDEGLPKEFERVALICAATKKAAQKNDGAPYYQAKKYLSHLLGHFNLDMDTRFVPIDPNDTDQSVTYYEPGRSATIMAGDSVLGRIGEYKASVRKALKLPDFCAGFELGVDPLLSKGTSASKYEPLSRFPSVTQDITLVIGAEFSYQIVYEFLVQTLMKVSDEHMKSSLVAHDIYQQSADASHKNVTFRLTTYNFERTLTDTEVSAVLEKLALAAKEKFGADRV